MPGYSCYKRGAIGELQLEENILIHMCEDVYAPAEDSCLAIDALRDLAQKMLQHSHRYCVDIGCGTGIIGVYCAKRTSPSYTLFIDINPCAVECVKRNITRNSLDASSDVVQCDNVSCIRKNIRDAIITYNTPYLPVNDPGLIGLSWSGGLREATRFSTYIEEFLASGCFILIYSSLSGDDTRLLTRLRLAGFNIWEKKIHIFFEDIKAVIGCRQK